MAEIKHYGNPQTNNVVELATNIIIINEDNKLEAKHFIVTFTVKLNHPEDFLLGLHTAQIIDICGCFHNKIILPEQQQDLRYPKEMRLEIPENDHEVRVTKEYVELYKLDELICKLPYSWVCIPPFDIYDSHDLLRYIYSMFITNDEYLQNCKIEIEVTDEISDTATMEFEFKEDEQNEN